jgi:hypothetical protein
MPYSRRSFFRDAALLSAGGVLGGSALALYEERLHGKAPMATTPYQGIRVVFAGSWLFCAPANTPGWMRAITVDMGVGAHHFPYGVWRETGFDSPAGVLTENRSPMNPYTVNVPGYTMQPSTYTIDNLFADTLSRVAFTYLKNPIVNGAQTYSIVNTVATIRVISLPIPAEIIPAAFLSGATVQDTSNNLQTTPAQYKAVGVPTSHIFDYPSGTSLTFAGPDGTTLDSVVPDSSGKLAHFHFHTVPVTSHTGEGMFQNLQNLLMSMSTAPLSLLNEDTTKMTAGPTVPLDVCEEELDMGASVCTAPNSRKPVIQFTSRTNAASCAGGGIGLGGDCGC